MTPHLQLGGRMWIWVAVGVAWGLVCVGVRVASLNVGRQINDLAAQRQELLSKVQSLERFVAQSGQLEQLERVALSQGFTKPGADQIVIVALDTGGGLLERFSRLVGLSPREGTAKKAVSAVKEKTVSPRKRSQAAAAKHGKKAVKR